MITDYSIKKRDLELLHRALDLYSQHYDSEQATNPIHFMGRLGFKHTYHFYNASVQLTPEVRINPFVRIFSQGEEKDRDIIVNRLEKISQPNIKLNKISQR